MNKNPIERVIKHVTHKCTVSVSYIMLVVQAQEIDIHETFKPNAETLDIIFCILTGLSGGPDLGRH